MDAFQTGAGAETRTTGRKAENVAKSVSTTAAVQLSDTATKPISKKLLINDLFCAFNFWNRESKTINTR